MDAKKVQCDRCGQDVSVYSFSYDQVARVSVHRASPRAKAACPGSGKPEAK